MIFNKKSIYDAPAFFYLHDTNNKKGQYLQNLEYYF